ncbi:hypothetical protein E1B28_010559 [Marasmius oreades]|uniref:Uncharacterized protein n=1 Tax=Marasmius oreades TaxID=181124 RepID=A0A9P7RXI2_9AGAR|nr:uncharacterized protein E1B28_010559 [Marasmius oreades]KAG7091530.1 hypothetical protein E1B28_010559 [Marasmius oreades]
MSQLPPSSQLHLQRMSQPPPPSQLRMSQPPPPSQSHPVSTTPNSPSTVDEYDNAFPPFSESMLHAVHVLEQHEQSTSSDPPLPTKRLLTPKKNAPSSLHVLAAQRKAVANAQLPQNAQNVASTPPQLLQSLRSPFTAPSSENSLPYMTPLAGQYAHPFRTADAHSYQVQHPQLHPPSATLTVPPGPYQTNTLSGPGIPTSLSFPPQTISFSVPPHVEATPSTTQPMLPHIEGVGGRPTKTEAQGLQESFCKLDSLLEKLAERLGTTPDLLLSRYLANNSQGRLKGKDNPWNTYQQWVLNNDSILIQEMQRLEDEASEDIKWDGHSDPDAQQLKLAFWKFKEEVDDWEQILREAKSKALLTKQLQRYRRKAFENIFGRIKSLQQTADNRYGFSGVAMLIGNQVNNDQSLAHIHTTSKVETFSEDCCLTDQGGLIGHLRSLAYHNVRRDILKSEVLAAAERLELSVLQSPTEGPSNSGVASTLAAAPPSTIKDSPVDASSQNASSIIFGIKVPNYSSESKLTDAARMALRGRASEAGLNAERLYWNTLHQHMIKAGLAIINWPHSVLQPWTSSSSSSKGIAKLDKASRMALIAACDEHCQQWLSFVSRCKADIRNSVVPILSFTPDADGKIGQIFLKQVMSKSKPAHKSKRKANVKVEADSDSFEGADSDELENSGKDIKNAAPALDKVEQETPTARPRSLRHTRANSQPPTAETASVKTTTKLQPPPKILSTASVKRVSFQVQDQATAEPSAPMNAPLATVINDDSISTYAQSSYTSVQRLSGLRNKVDVKPPISLEDLDDMVTASKRPSPPPTDEVDAKRRRCDSYKGSTPAGPTMAESTHHPHQGTRGSSTDYSMATAQQPLPPPPLITATTHHLAPPPSSEVSFPEAVPSPHPQRHSTPSSTIDHPQNPTYNPGFQNHPHHQHHPPPPQPQFSPEQVQAMMAMMAASGFQFPPSTGAAPAHPFAVPHQVVNPGGSVYHQNGYPIPDQSTAHTGAGPNYMHGGNAGQTPHQGGNSVSD